MAIEFKSAASLGVPWVRCMFVGPTGSGKTSLAATFPRPLFLLPYNEGSVTTLRGRNVAYAELGAGGAPVMRDVEGLLRQLADTGRQDPEKLHADWGQTLVLESLSHYQELVLAEIDKRGATGFERWGKLREHFMRIRDLLWSLPMHVVLTALDDPRTDDAGTVVERTPLLSGSAKKLLPSSVDLLGYCDAIGGGAGRPPVFQVAFQPYKGFPGRSRLREVPPGVYRDFSWSVLEAMLRGQGAPEHGAAAQGK